MKMPKYFFNEIGLRFSDSLLKHLKKSIYLLSKLSVKEQAEYVDMITYENVRLNRKINISLARININTVTAAVIGNLAFINLYHQSADEREHAKYLLGLINEMIENFYGKQCR